MKSKINRKLDLSLLPDEARVFQLDRGQFFIFTGFGKDDVQPFVRIGSSAYSSIELAHLIGNVVLPELHFGNIAHEYKEIQERKLANVKNIYNYRGSQRFNTLLSHYLNVVTHKKERTIRRSRHEDTASKKEYYAFLNYIKANQLEHFVEDVSCTFFVNGDVSISMQKNKIFQFSKNYLSSDNMQIEHEYTIMGEALQQVGTKMSDPNERIFMWFGADKSISPDQPFIYWKHKNQALMCHPTSNSHYTLFENQLDPNSVEAVIAQNVYSGGLVDFLCHKNSTEENSKVLLAQEGKSKLEALGHFYPKTSIQLWEDTSSAFQDVDANVHVSQCKTSAVLAWNFPNSDYKITQILFPLQGSDPQKRKKFPYIRSPHHLELKPIQNYSDIKIKNAFLTLYIPNGMNSFLFKIIRLGLDRYPLLAKKEYSLYESQDPEKFLEKFLVIFQNTSYRKLIHKLIVLHSNRYFDMKQIRIDIKRLAFLKIAKNDIKSRNNLSQFLRFLSILPISVQNYSVTDNKRIIKLIKNFGLHTFSYKNWLSLEQEEIKLSILMLANKASFLFVEDLQFSSTDSGREEAFNFFMPPHPLFSDSSLKKQVASYANVRGNISLDTLHNSHLKLLHYKFFLKQWENTINKNKDSGKDFSPILSVLHQIYAHKFHLKSEQDRFFKFIHQMGFSKFLQSETKLSVQEGLKTRIISILKNNIFVLKTQETFPSLFYFLKSQIKFIGSYINKDFLTPMRIFASAIILIILVSLSAMLFSFDSHLDGLNVEERSSVRLVKAGENQKMNYVPGEEKIEAIFTEVLEYANLLALLNGFSPINESITKEEAFLKDPDLIFPEENLRLPDGRLTKIKKGQHLLAIARLHYCKDYARIQILEKQMLSYQSKIQKNQAIQAESLTLNIKEVRDIKTGEVNQKSENFKQKEKELYAKQKDEDREEIRELNEKIKINQGFINRLAVTKKMKEYKNEINQRLQESSQKNRN